MTTLREAAQQALEALEESEQHYGSDSALRDAMQILRAALEQPEQGPVVWMSPASKSMIGKTDENGSAYHIITTSRKTANNSVPLYTHPPRREWRGLTDEEIEDCWDGYLSDYQLQMIRTIENKLKEKNA